MKINRPAFILGLNAVILQMAFLREWLCLFMGNELILGIFLGAWMLFTGLGSLSSSLPPIGKTDSGKACLATWIGLTLLPIPALLLLRWLGVQGRVPGETPGLFLLLPALLILMFPCFLLGLQFAFLSRAVGGGGAALSSSEAVRRVYLLESLGFAMGGFSFTILGLLCVQPVPILFIWTALNAAFIALEFSRGLPRLIYTAGIVILAALGGGAALNLQKTADGLQWRGFNLVSTVESPYGRIAVSKNEREVNIFQNGIYLSGSGEAPSNEEAAHLVLLAHRSPGKVLVLGGGGGLLAEILKQPVREAVYLQSDPFLLRTEERYLSGPVKELYSSARARLFSGDARLFVRRPGEVFDLIFCVLPPPSNILLNRFYTVEFYRDLRDRLAPGGMAAVAVESAEGYIGPELAARNGCILDTLSAVFPSIRVIPGWKAIFLASTDSLRLDPETLVERAGERKIELRFLSPGLIRHRFSPFQMEAFLRSLGGRGWRAVNTDARPLCFFFDLLFWFSRQGISLEQPLKFLKALSLDFPPAGFTVLSAVLMLILVLGVLITGKRSSSVLLTTWIMGFSAMALEIFIFTAFQAAYGYIYLQAGVLSAIFMSGSALGSARSFRNPDKTLRASVLGMASLALILFLYSTVPATWAEGFNLPEVLIQVFFALAMLLDGVFIGLFFPAANRLSLEDEPPGEGHPGRIYGWDLFGSGFGALFVATIVIPLGGLPAGGGMVGIMLLAGLLMRAIPRRPAPRR